ncbi:MAG: MBL fold metallo-hydrolase [Clostridiales bacterium]|nr:MBL fold metallo-hydrolase [Clostridiales bacterium]
MEPDLKQVFGSYMAWQVKKGTWIISFMNGTEYMYLLEGEEKALLLDTGYGTDTLKAFVKGLMDKEIVVANTHYHPDHSCGNGEFTCVYLAEGYPIAAPSVERPEAGPFDISKLPHPDYEKRIIGEGDTFDLGGRTVEVLGVKPAHCNSSLFFLDRGERMVFTGDEFEAGQTMMYDNSKNPEAPYDVRERLENMKENALRLLDLSS